MKHIARIEYAALFLLAVVAGFMIADALRGVEFKGCASDPDVGGCVEPHESWKG